MCDLAAIEALAARLAAQLGPEGTAGLDEAEAEWVLFPVTRERALPAGYAPDDLVATTGGGPAPQGAQRVRRLIVPDLTALFAAARAEGVTLALYSGFRSYETQRAVFEAGVRQLLARGASPEEAAERANRFRARPGHSQHQLGTTVDVTAPEVDWRLSQQLADTRAGQWLAGHAWEYGFVAPYTPAAEPRTGYAAEPWHLRWLGRPLAALLAAEGYAERADLIVDDYLQALELLRGGAGAACTA
ncbi:MAG TPA: M15 family metallopeptidase [Chloroflexota bacterium]|jgi:D-alanyl-D-alanine carboxypeptidase|nr:M15 family metallopeptidase [Chloroflexota bacterium]